MERTLTLQPEDAAPLTEVVRTRAEALRAELAGTDSYRIPQALKARPGDAPGHPRTAGAACDLAGPAHAREAGESAGGAA